MQEKSTIEMTPAKTKRGRTLQARSALIGQHKVCSLFEIYVSFSPILHMVA